MIRLLAGFFIGQAGAGSQHQYGSQGAADVYKWHTGAWIFGITHDVDTVRG